MAEYYTILTDIGRAKLAAAQAGGDPVRLATIHAGTGGGDNYYDTYGREELEALDALVDEVWDDPINLLKVDDNNPHWVIAEGVVPASDGGWMIREVGLKDIDGDLIVIGRYPPTYKPLLTDGAAQDLKIRAISEWSNAELVEIVVDPTVVMASQSYVHEYTDQRVGELLEEEDPEKALASKAYSDTAAGQAETAAKQHTDERIDPVDRQTGTPYRVVVVDGVLCIEDMTEE
ncbi:phage tail protein [Halomonas salipaludis]|nr:phage tail protein [Halomonas salipaludis]